MADGFFEWKNEAQGKVKTPYLFKLKDDSPFTFAGLYEHWKQLDGGELNTCTILTCEPNELVAQYHDRMPVILNAESRWE